jgi:hypothetical protein
MGMSGTGNTFSVSDTQANTFAIKQEVTTNVHVACGYSTTYTPSCPPNPPSLCNDSVTLTFQSNGLSNFGIVYEVQGVAPVSDSSPCSGTGSGVSFACDTQVAVAGPPFVCYGISQCPFIFSMVASTAPMGAYSAGTGFVATNIASMSNAEFSNSAVTTSTACPSSGTNSVSYGVACVFLRNTSFSNRAVGFNQFRQGFGPPNPSPSYNFTALNNSSAGFSFWFQLQPYNVSTGMAAFEVRVGGALDGSAELDYIFNSDPSVGMFPNNTVTHSLLFNGYHYGQWYHFSRNLMADWTTPMGPANTPLSLNWNLTIVQFEGYATKTGTTIKSETFWLDDVRLYACAQSPCNQPPPADTHSASFSFADTTGKNVSSLVKWDILDSTGQAISYTPGAKTLLDGPYTLEAYYPLYGQSFKIYSAGLRLDTFSIITLSMYPETQVSGGYLALDNNIRSFQLVQEDSKALIFKLQGTAGQGYNIVSDPPGVPAAIQENGYDLSPNRDWRYYPPITINYMASGGTDNVSIYFGQIQRLPAIQFTDSTGYPISNIPFTIRDSAGNPIEYITGKIVPAANYLLEAYYDGYQIHKALLSFTNNPVQLQLSPLDQARTSYLAINSTATGIVVSENSDQRIVFAFNGTGPFLVVVNVPSRPLFVERNGVQTANWIYNATSSTISIETDQAGTFNVIFQTQSNPTIILIIGVIAAAAAISILAVYLGTRKRSPRDRPPGKTGSQDTLITRKKVKH